MAPRRATYLSYGDNESCLETRKYIEDSGIILTVRDIKENPLSEAELAKLIGHLNVVHFVNKMSESYTKNKLDEVMPTREEVIKLMATDYTLIRKPIIMSTRLLTIGCDKKKISQMLQINASGQAKEEMQDHKFNTKSARSRA